MAFIQQQAKNFLGQGIIFPLEVERGRAPIRTGFELLRSSIRIILGWTLPKRFFLAEFNSRLNEVLEEPNDEVLLSLIETFVIDAIEKWEKRVRLKSAVLEKVSSTEIHMRITYQIINTQQTDTFVYPFYRNIIY